MRNFIKRLLNPKLKTKLVTSYLCILIIPSVIIGLMSYQSAKDELEQQLTSKAEVNVKLLDTIISDTLDPKIKDVTYFSKKFSKELYDGVESPAIRKSFDQYLNLHEDVHNIYIGTESGLTIIAPMAELPADFDPRIRDWYLGAMKAGEKAFITPPYVDTSTGKLVITVARRIADGSGVVAVDITIDSLSQLSSKVKNGDKGYAMILDSKHKYVVHPSIKPGEVAKDNFINQIYKRKSGNFDYISDGVVMKMVFSTNEYTGWKIAGTMDSTEISQAAQPIFNKTILILSIALIIGAALIYFIIKSITNPLKRLSESANQISRGDLTKKIPIQSKDEIGLLTNAFNEMSESLRKLIQQVDESAKQVAEMSEELSASADETVHATEIVSVNVQQVASSAEVQNTMVERNVQALEEVSKEIVHVTENSIIVNDLSNRTTRLAEEGEDSVKETVVQMESIFQSVAESDRRIKSLFERSKEIDSILHVITEISEQTNLLALNAAIEAARAGEHGKGFSIVAGEVRKLAEQSSQSAKQISELINRIQKDTEHSVSVMETATTKVETGLQSSKLTIEKFKLILGEIRKIGPQIEEISISSQQMSVSIQEVSAYTNQLASIAKENATISEGVAGSTEEQLAVMEEITASSKSLSFMADGLKDLVRKFKL